MSGLADADQSSDVIIAPWCGQKLRKHRTICLRKLAGEERGADG